MSSGVRLACLVVLLSGCDGESAGPLDAGDAAGDVDAGDGGPEGAAEDVNADVPEDEILPPVTADPQCGNGLVEGDEECDDRNRLNGDGCDWSCRLGDGEAPPGPDPTVPGYGPSGAPVAVVVSDDFDHILGSESPLVWTGTEFATVYRVGRSDGTGSIHFRRFDRGGRQIDREWEYVLPRASRDVDLVWVGTGFGLFYDDREAGILYMQLDAAGKPLGEPIIVEASVGARAPSADRTDDGFVLAWVGAGDPAAPRGSWCGLPNGSPNPERIRIRRIAPDGSHLGAALTLDAEADGPPELAAGDGGFGVVMQVDGPLDGPYGCSVRFIWIDTGLRSWTSSGILADGQVGDIEWVDGHYATVAAIPAAGESRMAVCVARFSDSGSLVAAPVCTDVGRSLAGSRLAAGDGGLAAVGFGSEDMGGWMCDSLSFLRTDAAGVAIGAPQFVFEIDPAPGACSLLGGYDTTWADDGFGVLYMAQLAEEPHSMALQLRYFRTVE